MSQTPDNNDFAPDVMTDVDPDDPPRTDVQYVKLTPPPEPQYSWDALTRYEQGQFEIRSWGYVLGNRPRPCYRAKLPHALLSAINPDNVGNRGWGEIVDQGGKVRGNLFQTQGGINTVYYYITFDPEDFSFWTATCAEWVFKNRQPQASPVVVQPLQPNQPASPLQGLGNLIREEWIGKTPAPTMPAEPRVKISRAKRSISL